MRQVPAFYAAIMMFALSATAHAEDPQQPRRYGLESGVLQYSISGAQQGTETVSFDQWGLREARRTEVTNQDGKGGESLLTLFFPDAIYFIDVARASGQKWKNNFWGAFPEGEYSAEAIERLGGIKTGEDLILGRPCEVWNVSAAQSVLCVWNRIPLKITRETERGEISSVASALEENAAVPEENFAVPQAMEIKENPDESIPAIG